MSIRATIEKAIPARLLNRVMLAAPALYRLPFVNYESNLDRDGKRRSARPRDLGATGASPRPKAARARQLTGNTRFASGCNNC